MSTSLETTSLELRKQAAFKEVQEEFGGYFREIAKHPRLLVGMEVPSLTGEGMERLLTSADAEDWQGAVKSLLADEIKARTERISDDESTNMATLHQSIELFQNNPDLVPGTKQFDKGLATRITRIVKPYEVRNEGKLIGYSVPIQALVDNERKNLVAERAAAAAATPSAPAPTPAAQRGSKAAQPSAPPPPPQPQAGIQSKSGVSTEADDYSVLFGTLGLPGIRF